MKAAKDDCGGSGELLAKAPPTRFVKMISASCLLKTDRREEARKLVDELLATDPSDEEALLLELALAAPGDEYDAVLSRLQGFEAQATHSVVWQMLPAETRAAFPRR